MSNTRFCNVGDRVKRYQYDSVEWSSVGTVTGFDNWDALVLWDGDTEPTPVKSYKLSKVPPPSDLATRAGEYLARYGNLKGFNV